MAALLSSCGKGYQKIQFFYLPSNVSVVVLTGRIISVCADDLLFISSKTPAKRLIVSEGVIFNVVSGTGGKSRRLIVYSTVALWNNSGVHAVKDRKKQEAYKGYGKPDWIVSNDSHSLGSLINYPLRCDCDQDNVS